MGRLIVIEGLDGSGKATQARLLQKKISRLGLPVRKVSFPDYDSDSSALVKMYLSGKFGDRPEDVNAFAASAFYAVDRFAGYTCGWKDFYLGGGTVIADRYTTSNGVHQCSKLEESRWDGYLDWLWDFEYVKMGIPRPDLVIYLDMSRDVSRKLLSGRYGGDESRKDIHEKDRRYLERSRRAARYCIERDGWKVIGCDDGNRPFSPEDISEKVFAEVRKILC